MIDLLGPASASGAVTIRPGDTRTFGTSDTFFRDCSDPLIDDGTEFGASWFNAVLANLRYVARGNGQTGGAVDIVAQDNSADDLLWRACQHLYQRGQPAYADDTGSANAIIVSLSPSPAELKKGMSIRVKIAAANSNSTPTTINVNGLPQATAKTVAGADLPKNALGAGQIAHFTYDGTYFQLVSVYSAPSLPKARILTASIASLPFATYTTHNLTLSAAVDIAPVMSASSFTLPLNGTYLFVLSGSGTVTTNNATNTGGAVGLFKNGSLVDSGGVTTYLPGASNQTFKYPLTAMVSLVSTDVVTIQTSSSATFLADYNHAAANAGFVDLVRLGP